MIQKIKGNLGDVMKWANIVFLFLFSLHLFGFPDKYIVLWCTFSTVVFWIQNRKVCLDVTFWILAAATILNGLGTYYYLADELSYTFKNIFKMVVPTVCVYPFMKQASWNKKDVDIERILLAIALGTFCYSFFNYLSLLEYGFVEDYRGWRDFWTGYAWRATQHSYWGCFIAGLSGFAIYCFCENKWIKGSVLLALIAVENWIQIAGDNRMVLCVTAVALAVSVMLFCILNIKDKSKVGKILLITGIGVVAIVFLIRGNAFGIRDTGYYQRFVTRNGGILKNDRFQMIYEAVKMLPSHWKGGSKMWAAGNYWVHNYWLQVANVSGIIPFGFWMTVNVMTVIDIVKITVSSHVSNKIKYMLIPMLASVVAYLMMEPGGTELNRYIIFYVLLVALTKQLANNEKILE